MNTKIQRHKIKQKLRANKKLMMRLLYPEDNYTWGEKNKVVEFMNDLLSEIPKNIWPENKEDYFIVKDGNWRLDFMWTDDKRAVNLIYFNDDHTAWVIENKNGKFVNFDIGGS